MAPKGETPRHLSEAAQLQLAKRAVVLAIAEVAQTIFTIGWGSN
jgi:hypothetical protein